MSLTTLSRTRPDIAAAPGTTARPTPWSRPPMPGERAMGYGVSDEIAAVPSLQPLAGNAIWRVILRMTGITVLVRSDEQDRVDGIVGWLPLQLDDLTDAQVEAFEAALAGKR